MQEMAQKTYAIQYRNFYATNLLIHTNGILSHFLINKFCSDENVVVNTCTVVSNFTYSYVDVFTRDSLGFYLVTCDNLVIEVNP